MFCLHTKGMNDIFSLRHTEQDVRFLAVDDRIEVWDKDACEEILGDDDAMAAEVQKLMAKNDFCF